MTTRYDLERIEDFVFYLGGPSKVDMIVTKAKWRATGSKASD
jgi:hypothetical protein